MTEEGPVAAELTRNKRVRAGRKQHINKKFKEVENLIAIYDGSQKVDLLTVKGLLEGKIITLRELDGNILGAVTDEEAIFEEIEV